VTPLAFSDPIYLVMFDSKTDSKADRQQKILNDLCRQTDGNLSSEWTSIDGGRQMMPVERFEPSTLAGPVFETGAYTVPPHRLAVDYRAYNTASVLRSQEASFKIQEGAPPFLLWGDVAQ
jgi:hypothetical protein